MPQPAPLRAVVDEIQPVVGPYLDDPTRPIDPTKVSFGFCFFGLARGVPVAGLAWSFGGDGIRGDRDGCAHPGPDSRHISVSAGGVTREYDIHVAGPTDAALDGLVGSAGAAPARP